MLFILLIKRWLRATARGSWAVAPSPQRRHLPPRRGPAAVLVSTGRWQEWFAHRKHPVLFVSWCSACLPQKGRLSGAQSFAQPVAGTQASSVKKKMRLPLFKGLVENVNVN